MLRNGDTTKKYIPKEILIEILQGMPEGTGIAPNMVGNLIVLDENGEGVGYIDLVTDTFEEFIDY